MMLQPNLQQVGGAVGGAGYSLWETYQSITTMVNASPEIEIMKSALIGAAVGFIITTLLRLAWDNFVARFSKRFKWLKPKK